MPLPEILAQESDESASSVRPPWRQVFRSFAPLPPSARPGRRAGSEQGAGEDERRFAALPERRPARLLVPRRSWVIMAVMIGPIVTRETRLSRTEQGLRLFGTGGTKGPATESPWPKPPRPSSTLQGYNGKAERIQIPPWQSTMQLLSHIGGRALRK